MMTFGYSFNIWVPLLLFPTAGYNGAPRWRKGWPVTFVFFFLLWAGFIAAVVLHRRKRKGQADNDLAELSEGDIGAGESVEAVIVPTKQAHDKD